MLFCFVGKQLRSDMMGIETVAWSRSGVAPAWSSVEAPVYHDYLTMQVTTHDEATEYAQALEGTVYDKQGRAVQVIRKGAKVALPPDLQRRRKGLALAHAAAELSIVEGEKFQHNYGSKCIPCRMVFVAINEAASTAWELASARWQDDGSTEVVKHRECVDSSLSDSCRKVFEALLS